jgi:phage terminase Nu1 subunit (DNA packaging protein)
VSKPKQSDIAKVLGITEGRVTQLKAKGMPVESIDMAAAWYRKNVDQKLSPKLAPPTVPPPAAQTMEAVTAAMYDLQEERARREHHEANLAELKQRQLMGELVEADRVRRVVTTWASMARAAFEKIPDKLAERMAAESDPQACHAMITGEIDLVLADLAAGAKSIKLVSEDGRA